MVVKCLKEDKSLGSDQLHPRTLGEAREEIAAVLAEIFVSWLRHPKTGGLLILCLYLGSPSLQNERTFLSEGGEVEFL